MQNNANNIPKKEEYVDFEILKLNFSIEFKNDTAQVYNTNSFKVKQLESYDQKRTISQTDFEDNPNPAKKGKLQETTNFIYMNVPVDPLAKEDFEFENREQELRELVEICVANQEITRANSADNTQKLILPIASQMIGSGKTYFGRHALQSFAKYKEHFLTTDLNPTILEELSASHYVLIDLRILQKPYSRNKLLAALLQSLIMSCPPDLKEKALKFWDHTNIAGYSISTLVAWFQGELKTKIFFHFDEVDYIVEHTSPTKLHPVSQQLEVYYQFWEDINILHKVGFIYCAGRSPQLFFIGRQKLNNTNVDGMIYRPPGVTKHLFFDRLLLKNIENMVAKQLCQDKLKLAADITPALVSKIIFNYTAGVPRFVAFTLRYLETKSSEGALDNSTLTGPQFFQDLFNYIGNNHGDPEIFSWRSLSTAYQQVYLQLTIDAILAVPYTVEDIVSSYTLGVTDTQLLQIIWIVGAFTAKTPQFDQLHGIDGESLLTVAGQSRNDKLYIIIPPLVANAISGSSETSMVLILAGLQAINGAKGNIQPYSEQLEFIGQQCFQNRLITKLAHLKKTPALHDIFPFLQKTILPNVTASLEGTKLCCLPKFVNSKKNEWSEAKEKEIAKLLKTPYSEAKAGKVSQSMEVSQKYWNNLVQHLQPGLYIPAEKSFSGDFYVVMSDSSDTNKLWLLAFQFKAGNQKRIGVSSIREDIFKCFDLSQISTQPTLGQKFVAGVVLVFVGGWYPEEFGSACQPLNDHTYHVSPIKLAKIHEDKEKAKAENAEKKAKKTEASQTDTKNNPEDKKVTPFIWDDPWPVPDNANLQVLLLNDQGRKHLLSTFNISITNNLSK